jgi:protein-S-isoprenylcysteine O-methyltransferase Ste14
VFDCHRLFSGVGTENEMEGVLMKDVQSGAQSKQVSVALRLFVRFLIYAVILTLIWRFSSGSWGHWLGWVYIAMEVALGVLAAAWVPLTPEMEEERTSIKAGVKQWDKLIVMPINLWFPFGMLVLAGLDHRFSWSEPVSIPIILIAALLAIGGRVYSTWAAASNPFYGRFVRIQTDRGHSVIEKGPYAQIRHPGYSGLLLFLLCAGVVLGSWWTVLGNLIVSGLLVLRTALEDKTLQAELVGYVEYAERVRYRLIPGIW